MTRKSYWIEGLASKGNDIRNIEVMKDGLLVQCPTWRVIDLLNKKPTEIVGGRTVWYFNDSKDREIAERASFDINVVFNPSLLCNEGFEITT